MKVTKEVPVTKMTRTVLDYMKCELCPATSRDWRNWPGGDDGGYSVNQTEVEMRTGYSYPECSSTTTVTLDICPECFKTKLLPWFKSLGGTPREEKSDDD